MTSKINSIHTFVISLPYEHKRRKTIKKTLERFSLEFEFFEAIDGKKLNLLKHKDYDGLQRRLCYGKDLSEGELGCFFSHRAVLEKIVNEDISTALIFEDDVILQRNFNEVIKNLINCRYPWEAVRFLGKPKISKMMQRRIIKIYQNYFLTRLATSPGGTYAYIVSNVGAKKLLKSMKYASCPIDTLMGLPWRSGLDVLTIQPSIASWDRSFESAIGSERFKKNQLIGWERFVYPLTRGLFKIREGFLKKYYYFTSIYKDKKFSNE
ncbi:glycosyltransferase family 25 protein [Methylophilaceae bacterium]|nr:glycosyltransferase family 25 protein [Methylophilaceae bacterium]|tara:strand:- start:761 stop:1558 length:798 start_codon:yes stop_codon:yes gene_type:complete